MHTKIKYILIVIGYYLTLYILGFDGLARQCQYNFLIFLLIYLGTLNYKKKQNK